MLQESITYIFHGGPHLVLVAEIVADTFRSFPSIWWWVERVWKDPQARPRQHIICPSSRLRGQVNYYWHGPPPKASPEV
jgi:hypothetical protein